MTLLAGLAVGVFVYFLVGYATGYTPEIKIRRFRRRAQISNRQLWLNQAGVAVTPRQFIAGSVAVGAVAFVAVVAVTGAPLVALVPAAGVAALPRAYFARRRTAHLRGVQAAWPDGLRDVVASIAAGRSLSQALNALAASGPPPLQEAFTRFPMLSRMLGTVPALEVIKEELADPSTFNWYLHAPALRGPNEGLLVPGQLRSAIRADMARRAALIYRRSVRAFGARRSGAYRADNVDLSASRL
jgi:tight adherence protein B